MGLVVYKRTMPKSRRGGFLMIGLWALAGIAVVALPSWAVLRTRLAVEPSVAIEAGKTLLAKKRVLAIVAHPDDLEWYVGGTLASLDTAGATVEVIVGTYGENGPNRTNVPDLKAEREQEQMRAAEINGYDQVHWLGAPDRGLPEDERFQPQMIEIWQRFKPDAVLAFDPDTPSMPYLHRDHQGSGGIVVDYWETLGQDRPALYLFQTRRPNVAVDISAEVDRKIRALSQHRTQGLGNGARRNRGFTRRAGELVGLEFAETFRAVAE